MRHRQQLNKFMNQIWDSGITVVLLAGIFPS